MNVPAIAHEHIKHIIYLGWLTANNEQLTNIVKLVVTIATAFTSAAPVDERQMHPLDLSRSLLEINAGFVNGSIGDRITSMLSNFEEMILFQ
jgi:hypothetical protein